MQCVTGNRLNAKSESIRYMHFAFDMVRVLLQKEKT